MYAVELRNVRKTFGDFVAVEDLTLEIPEGEFVTLLGPSGCGKTTTLRLVSGFLRPDRGTVKFYDQDVTNLPTHKRPIGMVFQNYALFPHMTVHANIAFGLRMKKVPKSEINERVQEALDLVQLPDMGARFPGQLSGGQQQRVALARALVLKPDILLLDEPMSNLDAKLRKEMQIELRDLHRQLRVTTLYVTHDQEEALTLADRLALMNRGAIVQEGSPKEIYETPRTPFVAEFIGKTNRLRGKLAECSPDGTGTFIANTGLTLQVRCQSKRPGAPVMICIRPERIGLSGQSDATREGNILPARVEHVVYVGSLTSYHLQLEGGETLWAEMQNVEDKAAYERGEEVTVCLPVESFNVLDDLSREPYDETI
jgi:spermidine/putrescine ABC transporter ATP-binding subunit